MKIIVRSSIAVLGLLISCAAGAAEAVPLHENYRIVGPRHSLSAGEYVEFRLVPPPPEGSQVHWSASNGATAIAVSARYRAPLLIPSGTAPIQLTASFRADDWDTVGSTAVTQIELIPGSIPGAADCLGPGQSFSPIAGVYPDFVFVDELPELTYRVLPEYPRSGLARSIKQVIVVRTLVCKSGNVLDAQAVPVIRDPPKENEPKLVEAAIAAVRQYVFRPARVNGEAVAVVVHVPVRFPPSTPPEQGEVPSATESVGSPVSVLSAGPDAGLSEVPSTTSVAPLLAHRFDAPKNTSGFGTSVGAGDFNGDGVPDLVIGGSPTFIYSGADHSMLRTIPDGAAGFGIELEVLGDVDGVEGPDLLIASSAQAGVYSGLTGFVVPFHSYLYDVGNDAGTSMASLGDVDADGRGDFIISELNFGNGQPRTTVFSGLEAGSLLRVDAGHSVTALGDVNGDGIPDFATGRYGAIHVVSGDPEAKGQTLFTVPGHDASLGAADVNGDGIKDLLLMMPQVSVNGPIGYVRAFSGANGDTLGSVAVPAPDCSGGCFFRGLVCGIGDVDGDGHEEFAASVVGSYGGNLGAGTVCAYSGATLSKIIHLSGPSPGAALGYSLIGPGDVDGDGVPDLLIGAPGLTAPGRGPGAALLYRLVHQVASADPVNSRAFSILPNPARRGTRVTFSFPGGGADQGDVMIADIAGRIVRQLEGPPNGRLVWDGLDGRGHPVSPGVYFVRSARTSESAKLVIID